MVDNLEANQTLTDVPVERSLGTLLADIGVGAMTSIGGYHSTEWVWNGGFYSGGDIIDRGLAIFSGFAACGLIYHAVKAMDEYLLKRQNNP